MFLLFIREEKISYKIAPDIRLSSVSRDNTATFSL